MRSGFILAAAFTALSATGAHAELWCGFGARPGSIVQCGYTSLQGCESAIGKGAMCFVNPYVASNSTGTAPVNFTKRPAGRG